MFGIGGYEEVWSSIFWAQRHGKREHQMKGHGHLYTDCAGTVQSFQQNLIAMFMTGFVLLYRQW